MTGHIGFYIGRLADVTTFPALEEGEVYTIVYTATGRFEGTPCMCTKRTEEELREEIYDEIVNSGELYSCELCKEIIRSQKMTCQSCSKAYLCTYCFAKSVMVSNSNCPKCNGYFLDPGAKSYLEQMVNEYKSDPQALFTLLQRKKKQLPPSLRNIGEVVKSAFGEAKARGEKIDL